jgi:hypothetical protein
MDGTLVFATYYHPKNYFFLAGTHVFYHVLSSHHGVKKVQYPPYTISLQPLKVPLFLSTFYTLTRPLPTLSKPTRSVRTRVTPVPPQSSHTPISSPQDRPARHTDLQTHQLHQSTHQAVRAAHAPPHLRPPFRRRNRQELETYIHLNSNHTQPWHIIRRGRRERGGGGRSGGAEEATWTVRARGEELNLPSRPSTLISHTQSTSTHTQCTLHRNITTLNPTSSAREGVRGPVTGRLPATPEPEDSTHNNTPIHNAPALHSQHTSLRTTTRGRRGITFNLDLDQSEETQHTSQKISHTVL